MVSLEKRSFCWIFIQVLFAAVLLLPVRGVAQTLDNPCQESTFTVCNIFATNYLDAVQWNTTNIVALGSTLNASAHFHFTDAECEKFNKTGQPDCTNLVSQGKFSVSPVLTNTTCLIRGVFSNDLSSLSASFTPTNVGSGTIVFYVATKMPDIGPVTGPYQVVNPILAVQDTYTVISAGLSIDADNNDGYGFSGSADETAVKQQSPGKVIHSTQSDIDGNGVPDFAEIDREVPGLHFYSLRVSLPGSGLDLTNTEVRFTYSGSDPGSVGHRIVSGQCSPNFNVPTPGTGNIRIWTMDGEFGRNPSDVMAGGDYVTPGVWIKWKNLVGNPPSLPSFTTLLMEGVNPTASGTITMEARDNVVQGLTDHVTYSVNPPLTLTLLDNGGVPVPVGVEALAGLNYSYKLSTGYQRAGRLIVNRPAVIQKCQIFLTGYSIPSSDPTAPPSDDSNIKLVSASNGAEYTLGGSPITLDTDSMGGSQTFDIMTKGPIEAFFTVSMTLGDQGILPAATSARVVVTPPAMPSTLSLSLNSKNRRVSRQGVPLPDPGPTGEGESDRKPNQASIDMFNLAPSYSVSDVSVPLEGGELTLEFRRTAGIHNGPIDPLNGYATERILGVGWDTNLGSHVVVDQVNGFTQATVIDDVGNRYAYLQQQDGSWTPDVVNGFNNDAMRCRLTSSGSQFIFQKTFGTTLTFDAQILPICGAQYYRLNKVQDRNGNVIEWVYQHTNPILPTEIHEVRTGTPRKIQFQYDSKERITTVTDPLGRQTIYQYDGTSGLLSSVVYPAVENPSNPAQTTQPTVRFTYLDEQKLLTTFGIDINGLPYEASKQYVRWVAPRTVTDARGHVTTYQYIYERMPSSIDANGNPFSSDRPRLSSVTTSDGVAAFNTTSRSSTLVSTEVRDTRGVRTSYRFDGVIMTATNMIGKANYFTKETRTTTTSAGDKSVVYEFSADPSNNLLKVMDLNGNIIRYVYDSGSASDPYNKAVYSGLMPDNFYKVFNQPAQKIIDPTGLNLITKYQYDTTFNKEIQTTDAEGKVTQETLDARGNRTQVVEASGSLNKTTLYTYDTSGFLTQITDPDGRVTTRTKDSFGNLRTSTDKGYASELGLVTITVMDVMGRTTSMTDPKGNVTTTVYDNLDRVTKVTKPAVESSPGGSVVSSTSETHYDLNGNPIRMVDDKGIVTTRTFDLLNRETASRIRMISPSSDDPLNDLVTLTTYDSIGQALSQTDPNGNVTNFAYDELLRLTQKTLPAVTLAGGGTTRYTETYQYTGNSGSGAFSLGGWQPTRVINKRGFATDTAYDAAYRPVQTVRRLDNGSGILPNAPARAGEPATLTVYNKTHDKIRETTLNEAFNGGTANQTTTFFYDDLHRLTVTVHDLNGNGSFGLPAGTFVNASASFPSEAGDLITRATYDKAGHTLTTTDAENHTVTQVYDGAGRLTQTTQPSVTIFTPGSGNSTVTPTTTTTYDLNGNREITTDPNGNKSKTFYDARNRPIRTVLDLNGNGTFGDGSDIITQTHYDLTGHVLQVVDPRGNATDTTYDNAYRARTVTGPPVLDAVSGATVRPLTTMAYDKNSNLLQTTDPRGVVTKTDYDQLNRPRFVTQAFGTSNALTTETQYDANNNVVSLILNNQVGGVNRPQKTGYTFDSLDRRTVELLPSVGDGKVRQTLSTYYRNGNVRVVTDPEGQSIESVYDLASRVTRTRHKKANGNNEEVRNTTYNKVDKVLTVEDLNGTTTYDYDTLYRVRSEARSTTGQTDYVVLSRYDAVGNRTRCEYPDTGRVLQSFYDRANRLVQIREGARNTFYTYDGSGNRLTCALPNGQTTTSTFDALNRVLTMANLNGAANIYTVTYRYDLVGNRVTINETVSGQPARALTYTYDTQYRLKTEHSVILSAVKDLSYTYDLAGNRLTMVQVAGGVTTTTACTYDDLNQLLTATKGGSTATYTYDLNGSRIGKKPQGQPKITYKYDVNHRLVQVNQSGVIFQADYDYRTRRLTTDENAGKTYFRYDGGDSFQELQGGTIANELFRGTGLGGGIGSILYTERAGLREHFTYNAVGDTVALTRNNGNVKKTDLYEAFGNIVSSTGNSENNRLANTKERSFALNLDNHGMRYYDPEVGRYLTRDPLGYGDGLNCYLYVHNNPINHVDPLGLAGEDPDFTDSWVFKFSHSLFKSTVGLFMNATGMRGDEGVQETFQSVTAPVSEMVKLQNTVSGENDAGQYLSEKGQQVKELATTPEGQGSVVGAILTAKMIGRLGADGGAGAGTEAASGETIKIVKTGKVNELEKVIAQPAGLANPRNLVSRQGPAEMTGNKIKRLASDMKANGFDPAHPIEVGNVEGRQIIIDGHHRASAAVRVGINKVPIKVTPVTPQQAEKLAAEAAEAAAERRLHRR